MGKIGPHGIDARQPHLGGDAGQGGCVHGDGADLGPTQPVGDGDRHEGAAACDLGAGTLQRGHIKGHDPRQLGQNGVDIACILAHQRDTVVLLIGGQKHTAAIEDQAACGRQKANIDPVLFG